MRKTGTRVEFPFPKWDTVSKLFSGKFYFLLEDRLWLGQRVWEGLMVYSFPSLSKPLISFRFSLRKFGGFLEWTPHEGPWLFPQGISFSHMSKHSLILQKYMHIIIDVFVPILSQANLESCISPDYLSLQIFRAWPVHSVLYLVQEKLLVFSLPKFFLL